jgi:hypothetical protein
MFVFIQMGNVFYEKQNVVRKFVFEVPVSTALLRFLTFKAEWLLYISPALNVEKSMVFL